MQLKNVIIIKKQKSPTYPHYLGPHCIIHTKYIPVKNNEHLWWKKLKKIPEPWVFSIEKIETIKRFLYTHIPPNLKELTYPSTSAAETKKKSAI